MKTIFLKSLMLAVLIPLGFLACKDDEEMEAKLTVQTLAGEYKLTELTQETAISTPKSIMSQVPACMRDDIFELKTDTTANYRDEGTFCDPPNNYPFDYEMTSNAVKLLWEHQDMFPGGTVKKWDGKTLVLSAKVKDPQTSIEFTITGTLVKQP